MESSEPNQEQVNKKKQKQKQKLVGFAANDIIFELINSTLSSEEVKRFETQQQSKFQESHIKKILAKAFGAVQISDQTLVALASICKVRNNYQLFAQVYIGELIEISRELMTEQNTDGPITPEFLQEAYRRMEFFNN